MLSSEYRRIDSSIVVLAFGQAFSRPAYFNSVFSGNHVRDAHRMHPPITRRLANLTELKSVPTRAGSKPANDQGRFSQNFKAGMPPAPPMFAREDWTQFRNLDTLGQKAGVTTERIPALVAKELADNSCDAAGTCRVSILPGGGLRVEDDGDGISGTAADLGQLFSVKRALMSSKQIRLPTRGALGNGLRVVAGAVLATGGRMKLCTKGKEYSLRFNDDGTTTATAIGKSKVSGVRIDLWLGNGPWPEGGFDEDTLEWARTTILFSAAKSTYKGRTSAYCYDSASFYELLQAAGLRTVRDLVSDFEGCSGGKAGEVSAEFHGRLCETLSRDEADKLLLAVRNNSRPVKPARLGRVGVIPSLPEAHAFATGDYEVEASRGVFAATIPYIVEAWARPAVMSRVHLLVNRTPATSNVGAYHDKADLYLKGCGLHHTVKVGRGPVELLVNIQCMHMPITTDGKAPDVTPMLDAVLETIRKAAKKVMRSGYGSIGRTSARSLIESNLDEATALAGGGKAFSLRQLFYKMRPLVEPAVGKQIRYENFCKVIGDHETEHGPIPKMYRDVRGVLYHPHTGQQIPLGTLAVKAYTRPVFTFNKILYCEKEGFFPSLIEGRWPERHDCALLTAKGFASRAARDVLDLLGESDEEILFFCIHDADAAGSMIYQALQEETAARGARRVKIVNLGLEPWEALKMGLDVETIEGEKKRRQSVAQYILDRKDGKKWQTWLQRQRVELNAMSTPDFIAWLDAKMAEYGNGRLVPPREVMAERLASETKALVEEAVRAELLAKHGFSNNVAAVMAKLGPDIKREGRRMETRVREVLGQSEHEHRSWAAVVGEAAVGIAKLRK